MRQKDLIPEGSGPLLIASVLLVDQKLGLQQRVRMGGGVIGVKRD